MLNEQHIQWVQKALKCNDTCLYHHRISCTTDKAAWHTPKIWMQRMWIFILNSKNIRNSNFFLTAQTNTCCLDSHSDGTHSLQRIHWWASDGMLNMLKSVPMKKQTYLHLWWPEAEYVFGKSLYLGDLLLYKKKRVTFKIILPQLFEHKYSSRL